MRSFIIVLFLCCCISYSLSSTTGKPPTAILLYVNHSSTTSSPSSSQGSYSLSFNVSLSRFMSGGEIVYLCGVLELLNSYKKEQLFCNRVRLHEYQEETVSIILKTGIYQLALQTSGGGGGQTSVYLLVSNSEFVIIDTARFAVLSKKHTLGPNEAEKLIQLHKTVAKSEYIDTTCIEDGQIFVEGKQAIEVSKFDSILSVKSKIFDKKGVKPELQRLFFMTRELKDTETLEESGVCVVDIGSRFSPRSFATSSLILSLRSIVLHPWTSAIEYQPSQTIDQLKTSILSSLSSSSSPFSLSLSLHHPKTGGLEDNEKTLKELGIEKTDLLNIQWTETTPVIVSHWSGSAIIFVEPTDTYETVKNKITEKIGLPANNHLMKSLPEHSLFLSVYNFTDVSKIALHPENIKVYLYGLKNSEGERTFKVSDTIEKVRTKIQEESGVKKENIILFCDGIEMKDEQILQKYVKLTPNFRLSIFTLKV